MSSLRYHLYIDEYINEKNKYSEKETLKLLVNRIFSCAFNSHI